MNYLKRISWIFLMLIGFYTQGIAGSNPISWTVNQNFPSTVVSGINYTIVYTFTNHLPVQLVHPLFIGKDTNSLSEFFYTDGCTGVRLNPNQSCTVQVHLTPLYFGAKFIQLSISGYDRNVVKLPTQETIRQTAHTAGIVSELTQALPNSLNAGASANYVFTFTNHGSLDATGVTTTVTQSTGSPTTTAVCSGTLAKNGGTCVVQGTFTPASASPPLQSVVARLNFSGVSGSPVSASTQTNITTPNALIVGSIIVPNSLPPLMASAQSTSVQFLFTNVSPSSVNLLNQGSITCTASDLSNCAAQVTGFSTQCTNGSLGFTQACSVSATFTAPGANTPATTYTLTGSLGYTGLGNPATITTETTVVSALPSQRIVKMVNNCGFTLSYSLNGAALPASASPSSCPPGSSASGSSCWWDNYAGASNILPNGQSDYVTIGAFSYNGIQWSGNISASIGCTQPGGGSCTQATCDNNNGISSCEVGKGFKQPATQAEITMLTNGVDSYDVEVINGFHIPVSMQPYYLIEAPPSVVEIPAAANGYSCGTPGAETLGNGFGACDWNAASPPSPTAYYYRVEGGSLASCVSSPCLAPGEVCGLSQPGGVGPVSQQVCGNFAGYWTPNQLCTQSSANLPASIASALNCSTSTGYNLNPADQFNNTYTSLMACPVATGYTGPTYNSCYSSTYPQGSSISQCCGCVNWWEPAQTGGDTILANNSAQTCPSGQTNSLWTGAIQGGIQWLKKTCPSVYVYPFDDATSKFTCTNSTQTGVNTTSYTITFCPGGITGLPLGKTDGRG
jgi:hypothetical protein